MHSTQGISTSVWQRAGSARLVAVLLVGLCLRNICQSAAADTYLQPASITSTPALTTASVSSMSLEHAWRVITLRDYNTRVVLLGVGCLGLAAGLIGAFILLRERALIGDALSHATLPGIGLAFILMTAWGLDGKWLPGLLIGATIAGSLGVGGILLLTKLTRIQQDAALGIVLSVFFGLGIAILGIVQRMETGHAAGLEAFIYGKTASMLRSEAITIALVAAGVGVISLLLHKEFKLLSFDQAYAGAQGWPVGVLDLLMMALVTIVTVIGLQAVGLILIIALLVIPPAAARFWTYRLGRMLWISAGLGALSGVVGAGISAMVPRLPAGAVIVLVAGTFFILSMVFGPARGILARLLAQRNLSRKVALEHLLRAVYELSESASSTPTTPEADTAVTGSPIASVREEDLVQHRSWRQYEVRRLARRAARRDLIRPARVNDAPAWALTPSGWQEAWRIARNHRLWELYLIEHADVATSQVDRGADYVEHVLDPRLVRELEALLADAHPNLARPSSPHPLGVVDAAGVVRGGVSA